MYFYISTDTRQKQFRQVTYYVEARLGPVLLDNCCKEAPATPASFRTCSPTIMNSVSLL